MKRLNSLLVTVFFLTSCIVTPEPTAMPESPPAVPTSTVSQGRPVMDYASLLENLRAAGVSVESVGTSDSEIFSVPRQLIEVNGEQVEVLEYADATTVEKEAAYISPDGGQMRVPGPTTAEGEQTVSVTIVMWVATPHFYRNGRLIVQYIGDNLDVINALEAVLGPQFAGGPVHAMLPIPVVYNDIPLPGGGGQRREGTAPPAWLIVGSEAIPGTVAAAKEEGVIADPAGTVPELPSISLPSGAQTVIVIGSDAVEGFQAAIRPWVEGSTPLFDPSEMKLDAEVQPAQNMAVFRLSPTDAVEELLLRADITFPIPSGTGSASYIWRLSPASGTNTESAAAAGNRSSHRAPNPTTTNTDYLLSHAVDMPTT